MSKGLMNLFDNNGDYNYYGTLGSGQQGWNQDTQAFQPGGISNYSQQQGLSDYFSGDNLGGTLGGISSGQDLLVSIALKPTSSLRLPIDSIDKDGKPVEVITKGRHDPCVGIRATPIAEAMLAMTIMDHVMRHRAQNSGVKSTTPVVPAQA